MQNHDLDDFVALSDAEISAIATFLHDQGETAHQVVSDSADDDEGVTSDDDGDVDVSDPYLLPFVTAFCHNCFPMDAIGGFAALPETDEWRCANSCRIQVAPAVEVLHFGPVK
jgi:hypothetical protein